MILKSIQINKKTLLAVFISFFFLFLFIGEAVFAQVETIQKSQEQVDQEKLLREKAAAPKPAAVVEEEGQKPEAALTPTPAAGQKTLIAQINVIGATLVSVSEIAAITSQYENKELTLSEMRKVADLITEAYRKKGYITTRAFLPPQKIQNQSLEIRIIEGMMGDLQIKGNRYYKTSLLRNRVRVAKGQPFDYDALRAGLRKINQYPDRSAKAILAPGKEPGTTDVMLEVKDNLPIHAGFDWDNYGSRYVDKDRFRTTLRHNNLLGWEDSLVFQYQLAQGDYYDFWNLRYLLPVVGDLKLGFMAARSKLDLQKEYEDLDARGKSTFYSVYATQPLVNKDNLSVQLNAGFDYKDVFNFQLGREVSRDRLRVFKAGMDVDLTDSYGRTMINNEIDIGVPDMFGGLADKDPKASRAGSGGKFVKETVNLVRLQKMPWQSLILWKNQMQLSPYTLTATEQYQIGGVANSRGYPAAEVVGDRGYSMSWEWSFPFYLLPKDFKVPLSKSKLYDAFRLFVFYDWANTHLNVTQPSEQKNRTLRSSGFGLFLSLPEDLYFRIEFGWPLDNLPSDSDHLHTWTTFSKSF